MLLLVVPACVGAVIPDFSPLSIRQSQVGTTKICINFHALVVVSFSRELGPCFGLSRALVLHLGAKSGYVPTSELKTACNHERNKREEQNSS